MIFLSLFFLCHLFFILHYLLILYSWWFTPHSSSFFWFFIIHLYQFSIIFIAILHYLLAVRQDVFFILNNLFIYFQPAISADSMTLNLPNWFGSANLPYCTSYRTKNPSLAEGSGLVPMDVIDRLACLPFWMLIKSTGAVIFLFTDQLISYQEG